MTAPSLSVIDCEPIAANVIETIEQVLEAARRGEISAVAIATVERSGCPNGAWSFLPSNTTMIGALSVLQHRITDRFLND